MFLDINMFLALFRPHFNPRYSRAKMSLSRAKNIFTPATRTSTQLFYEHGYMNVPLPPMAQQKRWQHVNFTVIFTIV